VGSLVLLLWLLLEVEWVLAVEQHLPHSLERNQLEMSDTRFNPFKLPNNKNESANNTKSVFIF
jgi:hypothetical protein